MTSSQAHREGSFAGRNRKLAVPLLVLRLRFPSRAELTPLVAAVGQLRTSWPS